MTWWFMDRQNTPQHLDLQAPVQHTHPKQTQDQGPSCLLFLFSLWSISFSQSGKKPSCTDGLAQGLQGHQPGTHRANEEKLQILRVRPPARRHKPQSPD